MALAPIILFAYNRPEHTRKTLLSLKQNYLANESVLIVYVDGPKINATEEQKHNIEKVKRVVREQQWCKEVNIIESDTNKGLSVSVTVGVTEVVNRYGKVIVLEDDLVSDKWFLKFMNDALTVYETNTNVACITGYIYPVKKPLPETFFIKGADCWGWATWKRGWDILETDGVKLLKEMEDKNVTRDFNFDDSYPYIQMLKDQIAKKNNSWAILWYASAYLKNKYTLYPGKSLIRNIGIDGSGTHSATSINFDVEIAHKEVKVDALEVKENTEAKHIVAEYFKKIHEAPKESFFKMIINKLKSFRRLFQKKETTTQKFGWFGDYVSWDAALKETSGYDEASILSKIKDSVLKVKRGEAQYERDSIAFTNFEYSTELLEALKYTVKNNNLSLIDFGGSLGSQYFQYKRFFEGVDINWMVVEQSHFVDCGKKEIADEQLHFFYTIEEALKYKKADTIVLSSVLPYIKDPVDIIQKIMSYEFEYIIIDRNPFIDMNKDLITVQIVPEFVYKASYPSWFFQKQKFLDLFKHKYAIIKEFDSPFAAPMLVNNAQACWKGFILKKL